MADPAAYLLTWHTYGSWLHGRDTGSVDRHHARFGEPFLPANPDRHHANQDRMAAAVFMLTPVAADVVCASIAQTCTHRRWHLHAAHVRRNHAHVVVASSAAAEKTLADLKAYATRALREHSHARTDQRVWSHHGSTRYLWNDDDVAQAVDYVMNRQGTPMSRWP